jgi:hypothetical protein
MAMQNQYSCRLRSTQEIQQHVYQLPDSPMPFELPRTLAVCIQLGLVPVRTSMGSQDPCYAALTANIKMEDRCYPPAAPAALSSCSAEAATGDVLSVQSNPKP